MKQSHIAIIGAPMDLGAGRRGVDMGPSALRLAGLNEKLTALGYEVEDLGNVLVDQPESLPVGNPGRAICRRSRTLARGWRRWWKRPPTMAAFRWCWGAITRSRSAPSPACRGTFAKRSSKLGLIWIDAHADMNTPATSPSGNVHGMPLACCIGLGPRELTHIGGPAPQVEPDFGGADRAAQRG